MSLREKLDLTAANKRLIDADGPLHPVTAKQRDLWYKIELAYTSGSLDGGPLSLLDTEMALRYGLSVEGRRVHELFETAGHGEAFEYVLKSARSGDPPPLAEAARHIHFLIFHRSKRAEAGNFRRGAAASPIPGHVPPEPSRIAPLMSEMSERFAAARTAAGPLELAAFAHQGIMRAQPFAAGSPRVARLLMNMALIGGGLDPVSIRPELREEYLEAVRSSLDQEEDYGTPFFAFLLDEELKSQEFRMRMLHIIEDPEPSGRAETP
ncbi:MAG: Fic family protein [Deltaproteobacteria bacterium]|nr:Fic family protein [Deltaproteobacteria bacterium]